MTVFLMALGWGCGSSTTEAPKAEPDAAAKTEPVAPAPPPKPTGPAPMKRFTIDALKVTLSMPEGTTVAENPMGQLLKADFCTLVVGEPVSGKTRSHDELVAALEGNPNMELTKDEKTDDANWLVVMRQKNTADPAVAVRAVTRSATVGGKTLVCTGSDTTEAGAKCIETACSSLAAQ